jgi:hypothetical protein
MRCADLSWLITCPAHAELEYQQSHLVTMSPHPREIFGNRRLLQIQQRLVQLVNEILRRADIATFKSLQLKTPKPV